VRRAEQSRSRNSIAASFEIKRRPATENCATEFNSARTSRVRTIARVEIQSFQHRPMDRFGSERIAAKHLSPYRLENQSGHPRGVNRGLTARRDTFNAATDA